jgi:hypothetical protein
VIYVSFWRLVHTHSNKFYCLCLISKQVVFS